MPPDEPSPPAAEAAATSADAGAPPGTSEKDRKTVNVLALLHYVLGLLTALGALPLIPLVFVGNELMNYRPGGSLSQTAELLVESVAESSPDPLLPADYPLVGGLLLMIVGPLITLGLAHGAVLAYLGRCLARRRRRLLCVIVSALNLTNVPLGTVLSLFTLIVLARPGVKAEFRAVREAKRRGRETAGGESV